MTNEEIIQRGILIRDETEPAQNTSERVGGVIEGIGRNLADKDTTITAEAARNGYYQCTVNSNQLSVTAPGFTLPAHGGNIRIKMSAPATGASTLNINSTGPKALLYNGAALSSANTWEKDEIISVFYDPSGSGQYLASNSQGGGGNAKKMKYDNSASGLAAKNVQDAIDEVSDELTKELYNHTSLDVSYGGDYTWIIGTINPDNGRAFGSSSYHHINIPVEAGMRMKITANQNTYTEYTFLKDINFSYAGRSGTDISSHYCAGYNNVIRINAGESAAFTIPEDCNYLYIACGQTSGDVRAPESVVVYYPKLDIAQETGQSTEKVMSQKAVTEELEVLGNNLIDMSTMGADKYPTNSTYLTATKDVENNGVVFYVNTHQTSQFSQGRIYPINLVAGKTYRLSFEYINTAGESTISTRNSSGGYIPCASIESKHVTPNTDYEAYSNDFIAPEGVYYISFLNLTTGAATKSLTIRNFSLVEVGSLKDKVHELDDDVEQLQEDISDIDNLKSDAIDIPVVSDGKYVSAVTGGFISASGGCHSTFTPTYGASKISVYAPPLGSSSLGIAFYGRTATDTFITPANPSVYIFSHVGEWKWITYDVPEGATMFRMSLFQNTPSKYCLITPLNYLTDIFLRGVEDMIATQIFRQAIMVSDKEYKYAFAISQISIVNGKAYMDYDGNRTNVDGDTQNNNNEPCRSIVDLGDMSHTAINPTTGTIQYYDGTTVEPVSTFGIRIRYITQCPTPDNRIAYFGLMRRNDNNPYYCWSIQSPSDTVNNWKTCRLSYNGNTVDFTINNYRQMLVDIGYASSYIASAADAYDNINIHYDKTEGIYYAVLCQGDSSLPLVMMQSTDLATWSPKANLGTSYAGNEIAAIYKDGIAYVIWRIARINANNSRNFIQWRIYDVANSTLIREGSVPGTKELDTKPDCFIFENNVYFAANVNPSVFGEVMPVPYYQAEARSEIVIYKIVDNMPVFFRRVCNPTGIDYYSFMEINPIYAPNQTSPIKGQNSIYVAFSEDRRHLYMRQIAQISFADVTALFADFGRIV